MDAVYQELDEAKAEIEKLREQYRVKVELAETLKRFNNDQVSKNKEASSKLEKIAEELNEKEGEIATAKQVYDELKINLAEKESIIRRITSAHDKLRVDCNGKLHKLEEENKALASALDDSKGKNFNQEQQISALKQEVEGVKRLLIVSQKKSAESESRTTTSKDVGVSEDAFFKLEEEKKKLEDQYRVKVELAETLKRFNNDQVSKNKEASSKLEKIAEELNEKEGEIATAKQVYDELKINLAEKESIIRRITSAHDKLRVDCNGKLHKLEEENKALASALDDSNGKNFNQEQQISALKQEVEGVKRLLNVSQAESESRTATSKDGGVREDAFFKLEEEKKKLENQLKWKKEQFVHLEEAHDKLRKNFKMREKEWEKERAELVHGISSLEERLESQTRISQDLQKQLEMCNSALAHAESKRKVMEVQLLESRTSLDNVCAEYDEAKLNFDNMATQRDQEIATLRSSLGTKDILYKEMEYQFRKLEQEKQELLVSLKDHQEAQIRESSFSSASKLQNKLKSLEQVHKGCSTNLKAKESEWHSQMEKLSQELDYFKSEVESKDSSLNELNKELEACDSLTMKLELLNQETSLMLLVLKSEFSEAQFRLADNHSCMNLKERAELVHGISSLEEKLESQTRISQDLQKQLEMCNSALAQAESKRKVMEVQLLESRTSLDNVCAEYDEAKLNFDNLATQRDQEIATLRSSLGTKDILYKEMEYQFRKLEQEKQELLVSLKDHQEAQICESSFSSASNLQNKLKSLEQVHKGCSTNLKAKESEWHSQMEKLSQELDYFKSEVESKDSSLNELNKELEACDSLTMKLELLNQETSLMLLVLKSEFSEAQFRLADDDHSCMNLKNKQVQENVCELMQQLEQKKAALISVQEDLEDERQKVVILSKKVQELEELQFPLQKEVDRLKEMLKESTSSRLQSEEQMLLIQADLNRVREALERADDELYEKFREANEIEFELRMWKSVAEQLEANLKQNHQMRKEVEASLLAQTEVELNLKQEKQILSHQLEEKEREIDDLQQQLVMKATIAETSSWNAEEDSLPQVDVRKSLHQLVEEKDQRISDLQQLVASLEHEFDSSTTSFSSRLSQMQREMNVLRESWEKIKADGVLKEMEIQEKNTMITELENDLHSLTKRVQQDKIEDEVQKQELEIRRLELDSKISTSEKTIKILSSENQKLIDTIGSLFSEKMNKLTAEDLQLMERLGSIVKSLPGDEEQENINILSPPIKKVEAICEGRSPLRAIVYN